MIHEVASSLPQFKTLRFTQGLNIVLADRTEKSEQTDTRNGSGKSSLVEIFHYLLGGRADPRSMFRQPPLDAHWFAMTFDLAGQRVRVQRDGATPGKVTVASINDEGVVENEETISNEQWKQRLAADVFGLTGGGDWAPSFRSCISYFLRRQSVGAFQTPAKHFSQQMTWDVQVNLSFLLGLDVELPRAWQRLRERERQMDTLRKAAKGGALGDIVGNSGELASELAGAEDELNTLTSAVADFTVIPTYVTVEAEVTRLGQRIRGLNNQIVSDREYLAQLESSFDEVQTARSAGLVELYAAAEVQLPAVALAAYDDVQTFHDSIIANRRQYLAAEIRRINGDLTTNTAERDRIAGQRSDGLRLLASGGAVETLLELQRDIAKRQVRVEQLRQRYENAVALESQQGELRLERQTLAANLTRDLAERQQVLRPAFVIFERLSQRLYADQQHGRLVINATDNGPETSATIPRGRSKGITNMQVYCFDITLVTLWSRQQRGPGFLVHDSHLFDGVDERQRASALQLGAEYAAAEGFQYVVTLNSDEIPKELPDGTLVEDFVLPQRLTDHGEDGGLFGIRF
ncbi:DUF2326 domain-containing protein [Amycolatopsis sp. BJA-103]|uniref:DUF2326 domain-containing protein n=1 Tax=Amycolatopsis sp. BJA-103 TaxID=1911175 RepID=UPI000C75EBCA|nr:DUF2326 domain-containing protein [Amycolatopsis sp. BJA-103]AUI62998.1 hypothetical protein BKN51_35870 [Amycolatopsis sp. BJA-103]PNE18840.1 hypothetical protein B1H26_13565 [Amycolatopsis sp. BJA-103]